MKLSWTIILAILTLLAIASGIGKLALMEQEVEFFGRYGFSNPALMVFGAVQIIGGALLPFEKTRFTGAAVVAITFIVSLVVLLMDGNIPVSIVTTIATLLLGLVMVQSRKPPAPES